MTNDALWGLPDHLGRYATWGLNRGEPSMTGPAVREQCAYLPFNTGRSSPRNWPNEARCSEWATVVQLVPLSRGCYVVPLCATHSSHFDEQRETRR